jgi:radical SAM superfamily enzyme YgiQ (UPF0313 family)
MTDFVLINPPLSAEVRYGKLAGVGNRLPNLGLAYLAGYLRAAGIDVKIIDAAALNLSAADTANMVAAERPKVCGLTAPTLAIDAVAEIAALVKLCLPGIVTVVGGPHVTSMPVETLDAYPSIDYGIIGEAEIAAVELFEEVANRGDPRGVLGLVFRDEGLVKVNPRQPLIENLDDLPRPAWDLLPDLATTYAPSPQSAYRLPSTILFTARGCPYGCTFCDRSVFGRKLRMHSAGRVFEMMEHLYRQHGIVDFAFHDESLLIDEARLVELCRHIQRSGLPISFSCQGRVDQKLTPFAVRELAAAGCWQIAFGIESGDPNILRILGKGVTPDDARAALDTMHEAGIATKGFFMLGSPGETRKTLQATWDFVLSAQLDDVMIGFFTPFPGTQLAKEIDRWGKLAGGYGQMSEHTVTFVPTTLDPEYLERLRRRLYRRFYLRRRVIRQYLRRLREPSSRRYLLHAAVSFLRRMLLPF